MIHGTQPIVTNGLVLALDASNQKSYVSGSNNWRDLSGNVNNGTLNNEPVFSYNNNGYFIFNGTDETATVASLELRRNFTLDGWFNQNVLNGFALFGQGSPFPNQGLHIWYRASTVIRFGMQANDTDFTVSNSIGDWYNIVVTYNHSSPYTKQLYINGVALSGNPQQSQEAYTGTGTFRLGATYGSGGNYGNGFYAGMKVYNRILSADEIVQNYNALKNRFNLG